MTLCFGDGSTGGFYRDLRSVAPRIFGFYVGFAGGLYFYGLNVHNIIEYLPLVRFDGRQHIRLIGVLPDLDLDFSPVECFRILVARRLTVYFVCRPDDLVQIGCYPHFICIGICALPLQCFRIL